MKAFLAHSFSQKDAVIIEKFKKHIEAQSIECIDGEKAESKSIADKVKQRIREADIFIGIFTVEEVLKSNSVSIPIFSKDRFYITSNWVIQESGYALGLGKETIFIVEKNINKFPELQGDREVLFYQRDKIEHSFTKLSEMLEGLKRFYEQSPASQLNIGLSEPKQQETSTLAKEAIKDEERTEPNYLDDYIEALYKDKDFTHARNILERVNFKGCGNL